MGIMGSPINKTQLVMAPQVGSIQQQGLAAQSVGAGDSTTVTSGATTSVSGVTNPAANSMMFGNRTNGSGLMNGRMTQSFGDGLAAMANSGGLQPQQNANQYSIVGGANMMV